MLKTGNEGVSSALVNYDEAPIAELEVEGFEYRLDTDQGSAVAISRRELGTWDWALVTEGRWDGTRLRAKGLDFELVTALAQVLGEAMHARDEE